MFKHSAQSKNTNVHRTQRNGRHDTRQDVRVHAVEDSSKKSVTLELVQSKSLSENRNEHSLMWANLFFDKLVKDTVIFGHSYISPVRH